MGGQAVEHSITFVTGRSARLMLRTPIADNLSGPALNALLSLAHEGPDDYTLGICTCGWLCGRWEDSDEHLAVARAATHLLASAAV